jgi:long-subunit acyl-CoA synthetase (AMP-forming)
MSPGASGAAPVTVLDELLRTGLNHPQRVAFRTLDDSVRLTWADVIVEVGRIALGLARLGVGRGDVVALALTNRPEFHLCDLAVVALGAIPFSLYPTLAPEQVAFQLVDSEARLVIADAVGAALLEPVKPLQRVVTVDRCDRLASAVALAGLVDEDDASFNWGAACAGAHVDDVVTLIYTSGTTGPPKGVELTHRNVLALVTSVERMFPIDPGLRVISWLPAAHIAERTSHHYLPLVLAAEVTCCPDPKLVPQYLAEVRPNWFFAVPRVWEKLRAAIELSLAAAPRKQQRSVERGLAAALERVRLQQRREPVPAALQRRAEAADIEHFGPLRTMLGLDELITANVGAAPAPLELLEFFHAIGIELAELYGMSESAAAGAVNPPGRVRIGTVGPPLPGVEIELADDGEVLLRGDCVMAGYRNRPEATVAAVDADGWLHTGDIGRFDDDGYLRIVDRKKELIITSSGKNVSPATVEAALTGASGLIGHACVIGDGRHYLTALIALDEDIAPLWAARQGLPDSSHAALARDPTVRAEVALGVERANARLARIEQVKRFEVVPVVWSAGTTELTPTLKLRRAAIAARYAQTIHRMYDPRS